MKIVKNIDGSTTTIMSFAETFLDKEILEKMTEAEKNEASKEIRDSFDRILSCEPTPQLNIQPERSKREDLLEKCKLSPNECFRLMKICSYHKGCGALNTMET